MRFRSWLFTFIVIGLAGVQILFALYYINYASRTGASYYGLCLWGCCLVPLIVPTWMLAWRNHAGAETERRHQELLSRANWHKENTP